MEVEWSPRVIVITGQFPDPYEVGVDDNLSLVVLGVTTLCVACATQDAMSVKPSFATEMPLTRDSGSFVLPSELCLATFFLGVYLRYRVRFVIIGIESVIALL